MRNVGSEPATAAGKILRETAEARTEGEKMKRVYVAGPYTKGDQAINVANAIAAANKLVDAGFAPFCPLLRLPGESTGADDEVIHAQRLGITVYHDIDELIRAES